MTTSPAVRSIAASPYGASELQRHAHRYLFIALGISIAIHLLIICLYYVVPAFTEREIPRPLGAPGDRWIQLLPPSTIAPALPPVGGATPRAAVVTNANPVPVADAKASPTSELPTQTTLSNSGNTIIGEGTGDGPGPTYTIVEDPVEGPPPAFQPVEREPQIIHSAVPEYPPLAVKANIQGRVVVRVWVDKQGRPREVHIWSSTDEILNDAALEAAKKYLFVPAYMNAGPVSVWVSLAFNFRLK